MLDALLATPGARDALADPIRRDRVACVYSQIACMRWMTDRQLLQLRLGQPSGSAGSLAKLAWSRADQLLADVAVDLLGLAGTCGQWATNLGSARSTSIAGAPPRSIARSSASKPSGSPANLVSELSALTLHRLRGRSCRRRRRWG